LCSIAAEPDDLGVLGGGVRGPTEPCRWRSRGKAAIDQGCWPCAKLDRVPGSAAGRRQRGCDACDWLGFATPAVARGIEQSGARALRGRRLCWRRPESAPIAEIQRRLLSFLKPGCG